MTIEQLEALEKAATAVSENIYNQRALIELNEALSRLEAQ